jgi:formate hydrogenlyase subunit 3/multisubunit Na+/H+ antiporter MnhD subunit
VKAKTESISIFSVKIPGALIRNWGAAILVGFQLYFLIHLRFYRTLLGSEDYSLKVPWIGYYGDPLSRFVTFVTSIIVPPAIVIIILWDRLYDPKFQHHFSLLVLMGVSLTFSVATCMCISSVWKAHRRVTRKL